MTQDAAQNHSGSPHGRYALLLVLAPLIAFGPLLLVSQWLWDDWVIVAHAKSGHLWDFFKELGRRDHFVLVQPFATYGSARDCTAAVLLLSTAVGPMIYTIIRRVTAWPATDSFWAALLTVLVPLNQARFVLSTLPYAFSSMFFVLALVLLLRDLDHSSLLRRALVLPLLLAAFSTNSFLVLAWVAPALVLLHSWGRSDCNASTADRIKAATLSIAMRTELLLAAPCYWLAKTIFQPTYGFYTQYNKFKIGVFETLRLTVSTLFAQLGSRDVAILLPVRWDVLDIAIAAALVIALFAAITRFWRIPLHATNERRDQSQLWRGITVAVAFVLCVSALFPYVMVGQQPHFLGLWETRHQTTLALVSGFSILAIYRLLLPRRFVARTAAVTAVLFLMLDLSFTHRLLADVLETSQIADDLREEPPAPGTMIYVVENDRTYRTYGRFFPFYELSWLARTGPAGAPMLAQSNQEFIDPATGNYAQSVSPKIAAALVDLCTRLRDSPQFGFGGFVSNGQVDTVTLTAERPRPGPFEAVYLAMREVGRMGAASSLPRLVHIDRKTGPLGGICLSPCCAD